MKKSVITIITILLIFALLIILSYIFLPNKNDITYIATIKNIKDNTLLVEELPGDSGNYARIGLCRFSVKNTLIIDKENNRIKVSDLEIGDTIIIIKKTGIITFTDPAWIDDVKLVKVVYRAVNEM